MDTPSPITYNGFTMLAEALEAHRKWWAGEQGGKRLDLSRLDLRGANLCGANLRDADLRDADLSGANLRGANLRDADLGGADLRDADLRGAYLRGADLSGANLSGAYLRGAYLPAIVKVENLDAAILAAIGDDASRLNMRDWHTCKTTHCRAGWAITLAGEGGRVLEQVYGPAVAGTLIYAASDPERPIPNFYATNESALADLKARAGVTA